MTKRNPTTSQHYPPPGPVGDLLAVEGMLDLLRIAVERDFAAGRLECDQQSAVIVAGHALRLVHRARLNVATALCTVSSGGQS